MKKYLIVLFSVFIILLCIIPITSFAETPVWEISNDAKTINYGEKIYELYEMHPEIDILPEGEIRLYAVNNPSDDMYKYEYVAQINSEIVYLYNSSTIYVTQEGKLQLDKFINNEYLYYLYFVDYNYVIDFNAELFDGFINENNKQLIDVTTLWNDEVFYIRGFDDTGSFAHKCGAVYYHENSYYYINFDALDNTYFDAYGDFSYRKGMVPAYKLIGENEKFASQAKNNARERKEEYVYPEDEMFVIDEDKAKAITIFVIVSLVFGFIIPMVPLILSIKFAISKKAINSKRWYWVTAFSALWIIISILTILCFII